MADYQTLKEDDESGIKDHAKSSTIASSSEENDSHDGDTTGRCPSLSGSANKPKSVGHEKDGSASRILLKSLNRIERQKKIHVKDTELHKTGPAVKEIIEVNDTNNIRPSLTGTTGQHSEDVKHWTDISMKNKRDRKKDDEDTVYNGFNPKTGVLVRKKKTYNETMLVIKNIQSLDGDILHDHKEHDPDKKDTKEDLSFLIKHMNNFVFEYRQENYSNTLEIKRSKEKFKRRQKYGYCKASVEYPSQEEFSQRALDNFWSVVEGRTTEGIFAKPKHTERYQNTKEMTADHLKTDNVINKRASISENATDQINTKCEFCTSAPSFFCENCSYIYCDKCLHVLHPTKGPFLSHSVVPVNFMTKPVRCDIHDARARLFCTICQKHRCQECVGSTCKLHFQRKVAKHDLQEEKTQLLSNMEKLTKAIASLDVYENQADEESLQIEMSAIYRRDQIRQEFVSFHDLLIKCEKLVLSQLDEDVKQRLSNVWRGSKANLEELKKDEADLSTTALDLIQTDDQEEYLQGTAGISDRYWNMQKRVEHFQKKWAEVSARNDRHRQPDLIELPFSLYSEKKSLLASIEQIKERQAVVSFKQKSFMLCSPKPFRVADHVNQAVLGPSMTRKYTLKLYTNNIIDKMVEIWQNKVNSLEELELNTNGSILLQNNRRYLLKLQGTIVFQLSHTGNHETTYDPTHMLVMTSFPVQIPEIKRGDYQPIHRLAMTPDIGTRLSEKPKKTFRKFLKA